MEKGFFCVMAFVQSFCKFCKLNPFFSSFGSLMCLAIVAIQYECDSIVAETRKSNWLHCM